MFLKKIQNTKNNELKDTASGFNNISTKLLKNISTITIEPLTYILNVCTTNKSIFLKNVNLSLLNLYSNQETEAVLNFGPISMLCNF